MSSERLLAKYRHLYSKAQVEVTNWDSLQGQTVQLLSSCVNIINRLPALQFDANYGPGGQLAGLKGVVLGKQMARFEGQMAHVTKNLAGMQLAAKALGRIAGEARHKMQMERASPSAARTAAPQFGAGPSVQDCVAGLHTMRIMFEDEIALKHAIVGKVSFDTPADDLATLLQIFSDQPNVVQTDLDDIFAALADSQVQRP